ncbi:chaplin family protein [Streptomyces sp. NPDC001068]|uniref:chaplin family protein n=1 Tax=Streptomyces sp. NPDC001068 TaxID=3364544 RepID=UPI0036814FA2
MEEKSPVNTPVDACGNPVDVIAPINPAWSTPSTTPGASRCSRRSTTPSPRSRRRSSTRPSPTRPG